MKLPISFGNRFFFRVVFPGALLSAALYEITFSAATRLGFTDHLGYIFAVQIFVIGWLFVILDMPIYILFEGRRYWPRRLFRFFFQRERDRLSSLHRLMRRYGRVKSNNHFVSIDANRIYLEAALETTSFPYDTQKDKLFVQWPTRLGNLIAAFEQYPRLKFGLDSVFFWPRLWLTLEQAQRDEIDNYQAQADGLLYASLALALSVPIFCIYGLTDLLKFGPLISILPWYGDLLSGVICATLSFIIYRVSLHSHRQFGEIFKAAFDQNRSKLVISDTVDLISHVSGNPGLTNQLPIVQNIAVTRFLKWHLVRPRGQSANKRVRLP